RGADSYTGTMFTMSKRDDFVPASHALRPIRLWLNDALKRMAPLFARMYESDAKDGRPSIAPAKLFRKSRRTGALLCYIGHVLSDNRHGRVVNARASWRTVASTA